MILHIQRRQDWIRGRREKRNLARTARLRRQIFRYSLLCLLLAVAASAFKYLPWAVTDVDYDIVVKGNQVVNAEQVRTALKDAVGKPLYKLDPHKLEDLVRSLQAVRFAFVRRYVFPHPKLVVDVLEEFPWATLAPGPGGTPEAVISDTGRIIPLERFPAIARPDFKIYGPSSLKLDAHQISQWAGWVSYIAAQTGVKVDYVDMRVPAEIAIQDGELYLKIGAADSTLTKRLGRLASLMPSLTDLHGRLQYVDLGLDNNIPLKVSDKSKTSNQTRTATPIAATSGTAVP